MQNSTKSSLANRIKTLTGFDVVAWLPTQWRTFTFWHLILTPLSWLFLAIISIRKWLYHVGLLKSTALSVPVIIVGNINVGGTGKTPLVMYLVQQFKKIGLHPGVISRGFGGKTTTVKAVAVDSLVSEVGDEPLLLKRRLDCPVYVHQDRVLAGQALLNAHPECDIIISDDGLQHYRLKRDLEIVVVDAMVAFGNGAVLPAGPLREPVVRLKAVDAIVINGDLSGHYAFFKRYGSRVYEMQLVAQRFYNLENPQEKRTVEDFFGEKVIAIAGIGNPARFFKQLQLLGLHFQRRVFEDHHAFSAQDFQRIHADIILMTEKDAVKCRAFVQPNFWVLPVSAELDEEFMENIFEKLESAED